MVSDNYKTFQNEELSKKVEPLVANGELRIKLMIRNYLLNSWSEQELMRNIDKTITSVMTQLPKDTPNPVDIFKAFKTSSRIWYNVTKNQIKPIVLKLGIYNGKRVDAKWIQKAYSQIDTLKRPIVVATPQEVRVQTGELIYNELIRLDKILKKLSKTGLNTEYTPQKTPMSVFAKLEMDIRLLNNMEQLQDKYLDGEIIVRFSQHYDCSERCEPWQGKAVHLLAPAINEKLETGLDWNGEPVYSYQAITTKRDKYGYQNNIHVGWNCRHYLKPVEDKRRDPIPKGVIAEARKSNQALRYKEKKIRDMKRQYNLLLDDKSKTILSNEITEETKRYFQFAKNNKVIAYGWRLET
jgi:hypothetical protein